METEVAPDGAAPGAGAARGGPWLAAAVTLGLCVVAASSATTSLWENPDPTGSQNVAPSVDRPPEEPPEPSTPGEFDWPDLGWLLDIASIAALVLLVAAIALAVSDRHSWIWQLRWRRRRTPATPAPPQGDVPPPPVEVDMEAAVEALTVGTPRNGIVRCWMQLERDASDVGLERIPSETAAEYAERVVASSSVDPRPIGELAALYREARFSRHELTADDRARARRALDGVAEQLTGRARDRT